MKEIPIIVLPGMGADHRMYAGPWHELPGARFLDWPQGGGFRTIREIAGKIMVDAGIGQGAVLIGSSLGGIVACEIARLQPPSRLFLIGSAINPAEINGLLRLLSPLIEFTPLEFVQRAAGKLPSELGQMFSQSQAEFIRTMCRAVFAWEGLNADTLTPLRLHGRHDAVIPAPREVDLLLNGGHLLAMTHARECVEFIRANLGLR